MPKIEGEMHFKSNLAYMFTLKCSCAWHILGQWRDVHCHGNSVLFKKLENKTFRKQCKRNWVYMLALRCRCARNVFKNGEKCVAMVTTLCQQLRGESIFKLNLAHMFALKCRCVGHILGQWQNVCCHGNGILFQKLKNKTYCDAMNNCAGRGY